MTTCHFHLEVFPQGIEPELEVIKLKFVLQCQKYSSLPSCMLTAYFEKFLKISLNSTPPKPNEWKGKFISE
jgi:hypothetical protein